eukprot:13929974-Alexandrium_andersonii.AAC.1
MEDDIHHCAEDSGPSMRTNNCPWMTMAGMGAQRRYCGPVQWRINSRESLDVPGQTAKVQRP